MVAPPIEATRSGGSRTQRMSVLRVTFGADAADATPMPHGARPALANWFDDDSRHEQQGITLVPAFLAARANQLADASADRQRLRARQPLAAADCGWALNDAPR